MARYGSERIRGHGIPEAIEAILINGSRVEPQARAPQAALVGDLDRLRRPVRRGRADHHDRRRVRLDDRAVLPPDQRRAQDAAGRGRGGGHVGDLRRAGRGRAAGGGAAAVRMEAAQLIPVALASATAARRAALHPRHWARCSRSRRIRVFIGPAGLLGCVARRAAGGRALGAADRGGLRRRGRLPAAADPLDVVAGDRRPGRRHRRPDLPAGARRRLRHHRRAAAGRRRGTRDRSASCWSSR